MSWKYFFCVVILENILIVCILFPFIHNFSNEFQKVTVERDLYEHVRVLCFVPCSDNTVNDKAIHVMNTWGKHCNKLIFFTDKEHTGFPTVGLGIPYHGKHDLTMKMFSSLFYLYEHHLNDYDWFMKADTDSYVIIENLRFMLANYTTSKPIYFGQYLKVSHK